MKNIAIILSGGIGSRMNNTSNLPKQYLKIGNNMVIEHTIAVFQNNLQVDEIFIIAEPRFHDLIVQISKKNNFTKVTKILNSGNTRNRSTWSAISTCKNIYKECNILLHDAVRPFISSNTIDTCILSLEKFNAVCVVTKTTDTIFIKNKDNNYVQDIPDRNFIFNAQTPQCFKLSTIYNAYLLCNKDAKTSFSDDCGIVKKYLPEEKIFIIIGDHDNIKITYPEDLIYANMLIK